MDSATPGRRTQRLLFEGTAGMHLVASSHGRGFLACHLHDNRCATLLAGDTDVADADALLRDVLADEVRDVDRRAPSRLRERFAEILERLSSRAPRNLALARFDSLVGVVRCAACGEAGLAVVAEGAVTRLHPARDVLEQSHPLRERSACMLVTGDEAGDSLLLGIAARMLDHNEAPDPGLAAPSAMAVFRSMPVGVVLGRSRLAADGDDPGLIDNVRSWLRDLLNMSPSTVHHATWRLQLELALVEWTTNIIRHAYEAATAKPIDIEGVVRGDGVVLRLTHRGLHFEPPAAERPPMRASSTGGWGLYILQQTVDRMDHARDENGWSTTTLAKVLPPTLLSPNHPG